MELKWILVIIFSLAYIIPLVMRKPGRGGDMFSGDLEGLIIGILLTLAYAIFWIIWLIIF